MKAPDRLIDPEGEGLYQRVGSNEGLRAAAYELYGDAREWRKLKSQLVYLRPGKDDHWYPASVGKHPRGWRLNLPKRWCPVAYLYYTPGLNTQ